jgi:hypothetical protein
MQWAAACSVAGVVTAYDRWIDSTALHEARSGAYDAAVAAASSDPQAVVPAAIAGARRALYWERETRARLVPPVSMGSRRWREVKRFPGGAGQLVSLAVVAETEDPDGASAVRSPANPTTGGASRSPITVVADRLVERGWPWSIPPGDALEDAVQAVLTVGRDRASSCLSDMHGDLPAAVSDGVVLLLAGSRQRVPCPWPGVVWLAVHRGIDAALADPGVRAVIDALVEGRRSRPSLATGSTVLATPARRLQLSIPRVASGRQVTHPSPPRRGARPLAVAS